MSRMYVQRKQGGVQNMPKNRWGTKRPKVRYAAEPTRDSLLKIATVLQPLLGADLESHKGLQRCFGSCVRHCKSRVWELSTPRIESSLGASERVICFKDTEMRRGSCTRLPTHTVTSWTRQASQVGLLLYTSTTRLTLSN